MEAYDSRLQMSHSTITKLQFDILKVFEFEREVGEISIFQNLVKKILLIKKAKSWKSLVKFDAL